MIATRNRASSLLESLERLSSLPEEPPVVVVDNGSADGTVDLVRSRFPEVHVVALNENLSAAARNIGVERAETPYVAFCDDDSWWAPASLVRAVKLLDTYPRLALIAARVIVEPESIDDPVCLQMAESPLPSREALPGPSVLGFIACGAVVRREAFLQAGGFAARYGVGGEEELLAIDLRVRGWRLAYVPEVVAHHHPSPSRDRARRKDIVARNLLWTTWLRRPRRVALSATARFLIGALRDRSFRRVLYASAGLPWILRNRRVVPAWLEEELRLLE